MIVLWMMSLAIMAVFMAGVTFTAVRTRRRAEQASFLSMLAISVDRKFPVADEIQALAEGTRVSRRRELFQLANLLRTGHPIDTALATVPHLVTPDALLTIQTGADVGLLPQAVREEARRESEPGRLRQPMLETFEGWFVYALGVSFVLISIVTFLTISIMPKFRKIFDDFGMALPDVTIFAMDIADAAINVITPLPVVVLIGLIYVIYRSFFARLGWKDFDPSLFGGRVRRFDTPTVLRTCALQVEARQPVSEVFEAMSKYHWRPSTARWLKRADQAVSDGKECWPELVRAGLLTGPEAQVLMAAERAGNLSWSLRALADAMELRRAARFNTFKQFLRPIVVFPMGLVVLLVMAAFFVPLVSLINGIS